MRGFLTTLLLFFFLVSFSQEGSKNDLSKLHFSDAIKTNQKLLSKDTANLNVRHNLAIAYCKTGKIKEAYEQYRLLVSADYKDLTTEDWNNIAQFALANGDVKMANMAYDQLSQITPIQRIYLSDNGYYESANVEDLNSDNNDFSPVGYEDQLVFTSDRPLNVYDLSKDNWTAASYLGVFKFDTTSRKVIPFGEKLNELGHTGPVSFSQKQDVAFITHSYKKNKKGVNQTEILIGSKGKNWKEKSLYEYSNNDDVSYAHPVLLEELNMLVFSSNQEGGSGDMDLYYSKYENGKWQEPVNIQEINTPFKEVFPCVKVGEPSTIYFSSNGYRGFGGLDIYQSTYENGKWSEPKLLPRAINSSFDDFGLFFTDDKNGFVSSNRPGGLGGDDIYRFNRSNHFLIEGYLVDESNLMPLPFQKVYLIGSNNQIIDSVIADSEGYFRYNQLPYQNVGLMPPSEENVEMVIRPLDQNISKDPYTNMYLVSSKGYLMDSIALDQPEVVTYVIESYKGKKSKCVVYENGDKATFITFKVKDESGNTIDQVTTGSNGCFKLEKLYPDGSYLELDEELTEMLGMRLMNSEDNTNWQEDSKDIRIISNQKCVEYEDGTPAINVSFAVKDSTGAIIDRVVTNQNGCFSIRKLYDQDTYLSLLDESLADLGIRLKPPFDEEYFDWQKEDERIVLKYGKKCMVFKDGGHPSNAKYIIKDEDGNAIDGSITDEDGCLKLKHLHADNSLMVYLLDEDGLTYKAKMDKDIRKYLILEKTEMATEEFEFVTITVKRCAEYEDGSAAVQIRFAVMSESNQQMDQFITDTHGCFTIRKLYDKSTLVLDEEELVSMGMYIKNTSDVTQNWNTTSDKIILTFAEKCLTYENGKTASNAKYNIRDPKETIVESGITDKNGCLKLKKLYTNDGYFIELLDETGMTIRIPTSNEISTAEKLVFDNIYFEYKSYTLDNKSKEKLESIVDKLKAKPELTITINAHTDSRGGEAYNQNLSQKRADAVADFLVSRGISKQRIKTNGYGETQLLNQCQNGADCSESDHALNRRIEMIFGQ